MPRTIYMEAIEALNAKATEMGLVPFSRVAGLSIYVDASGTRPGADCALYLSQESPKRDPGKGIHQFQVVVGGGDLAIKSLEEMARYVHDRAIRESKIAGRPRSETYNGLNLE